MPTLLTYEGNDAVVGTLGDDYIIGSNGTDVISGLLGYDTLDMSGISSGLAVTHTVDQGIQLTHANGQTTATGIREFITTDFDDFVALSGMDVISQMITFNLEGGDDVMTTGQDDFTVYGGDGNDQITGNLGNDTLRGQSGDDILNGGSGDDLLTGNQNEDILNGGSGDDILDGGTQDDVLNGGDGDDSLYGARGNDVINGGAGNDALWGGRPGDELEDVQDTFVFADSFGQDTIHDFMDGCDLIDFSGHSSFGTFADVIANASDDGTDLTIQLDAQNTLIIENFTLAEMDASDFVF